MTVSKKLARAHLGGRQLPLLVPDSDWVTPSELPDLRRFPIVALDCETMDLGLGAGGSPGWMTGVGGRVCGVSAAWREAPGPDGIRGIYLPVAHPDSECLDHDAVGRWLRDLMSSRARIAFHNAPYDLGWMRREWGVMPPEHLEDTNCLAVMIDENLLSYRLEALCAARGLPGKDERLLREAATAYRIDPKAEMWRLPARFVGPYGAGDPIATLRLLEGQERDVAALEVDRDGDPIQGPHVRDAYRTEMELVPLVVEMMLRGVRVNLDAVDQQRTRLLAARDEHLRQITDLLSHRVGMDELGSAKFLETAFREQGISFPRTEKTGQASFESSWMSVHEHRLPRLIAAAREANMTATKFLGQFISDHASDGRLHPSVHQYISDEDEGWAGTRSYRFSYSGPPLQQMPGDKKPAMRDAVRSVFEPEEGETWAAIDYRQQEMKLGVHYAALLKCTRAEEAVRRYADDPNLDFHSMVADMTGLGRRHAKDVNFAKMFGAGVGKFAAMTGKSMEEAEQIMRQYDEEMPFLKELSRKCKSAADSRGYIRLADGARSRFDMWEPAWREKGEKYEMPRRRDEARALWPDRRLRRAYTHKAMNRLIQGTAARQMKKAMVLVGREKLCVPLLQLHDELSLSVSDPSVAMRVGEIMRCAMRFKIDFGTDVEFGRSWGEARKVKTKDASGVERVTYDASWASAQAARMAA